MKLVVWLWNPWAKYTLTKHNLWFLAVDELVELHDWTDYLLHKKFAAHMSSFTFWKWNIVVAKPQEYMNKSWSAVQKIMSYYWIKSQDVLVVHDDLDLWDWVMKLKYGWSHWWHNWIRDIIAKLGEQKFWRLKLGIWRPSHPGMDIADFVLSRLSDQQQAFRWSAWHDIQWKFDEWLRNSW